MNSSQLAISRSDAEFLTPTPITTWVGMRFSTSQMMLMISSVRDTGTVDRLNALDALKLGLLSKIAERVTFVLIPPLLMRSDVGTAEPMTGFSRLESQTER